LRALLLVCFNSYVINLVFIGVYFYLSIKVLNSFTCFYINFFKLIVYNLIFSNWVLGS